MYLQFKLKNKFKSINHQGTGKWNIGVQCQKWELAESQGGLWILIGDSYTYLCIVHDFNKSNIFNAFLLLYAVF